MKLLLTSGGVTNDSIRQALVDLLGKPIEEASALCIPTAIHALPGGAAHAYRFISGTGSNPMTGLGWKSLGVLELTALDTTAHQAAQLARWKSLGVLELTALPGIDRELWLPTVFEADALLVNGGDPLYLHHWMRQSGLANLLPSLSSVYVGLSAGSMIMTPRIGQDFVNWTPPTGGDETLGLVDFAIFPHLDHPDLPDNSMADAERWAATLSSPSYAIDDQTAIKVTGGEVKVISEGHWRSFEP